jgi:hypothetical protein
MIQQKKQSFCTCTIYNFRLDEIIVKYAREMNTLVSLSHGGQTHSCTISFISAHNWEQRGKIEVWKHVFMFPYALSAFYLIFQVLNCYNVAASPFTIWCRTELQHDVHSCTPMPVHDQVLYAYQTSSSCRWQVIYQQICLETMHQLRAIQYGKHTQHT